MSCTEKAGRSEEVGDGASCVLYLSWVRGEKDQLEEQLRRQEAEAEQLQEKLTEEQKVRTSLETVLAQATSLLRDIMQVSSGRHQGASGWRTSVDLKKLATRARLGS